MVLNSSKISFLSKMLRLRNTEQYISQKYKEQKMRCPIHLSIGQEAIAVGVCENLSKKDRVFSTHRSHYHYLSKGGNLNKMIAELYLKKNGCNHGLGGSMHLKDIDAGMISSVPIVGSTLPIAVGSSWGQKIKKENDITVVFFGEAATEEGVFHESLDFASLHGLPILFICENNLYSVYSHIRSRQSINRKITNLSKAHGVLSKSIQGNDIEKVFEETRKAISYIRSNKKPFLIEFNTYRFIEHCGPSNDDHLNYRPIEEINFWKKNCPIEKYKKKLFKKKIIKKKTIEAIINNHITEIRNAFNYAEKSKHPLISEIKHFVYS